MQTFENVIKTTIQYPRTRRLTNWTYVTVHRSKNNGDRSECCFNSIHTCLIILILAIFVLNIFY